MTKITIWEKLQHFMICVTLLESCLTISEISIQRVQIAVSPILVLAQLMISKAITQQMMLAWAFEFKSLKTIN